MAGSGPRPTTVGSPVFAEPRFKIIADAMIKYLLCLQPWNLSQASRGQISGLRFSVMVKNTSQVMVGGPALVERALGVSLTKEELGGWKSYPQWNC